MSTITTKKLFNVNEFQKMAETGILSQGDRFELIRGEFFKMSPIGSRHDAIVDAAAELFWASLGGRVNVRVQGSVILDLHNQPQPDVVLMKRRADFYASKHPGPDDILLIVEVSDSSLQSDQTVKLQLYAEMGVLEYWVVDLQNNVLFAYSEPQGTSYRMAREHHRGESISPAPFPDCRIQVDALLL